MDNDNKKDQVKFNPDWYQRIGVWSAKNWYLIAIALYFLFFFVWPLFINEPPDDPYFYRR